MLDEAVCFLLNIVFYMLLGIFEIKSFSMHLFGKAVKTEDSEGIRGSLEESHSCSPLIIAILLHRYGMKQSEKLRLQLD